MGNLDLKVNELSSGPCEGDGRPRPKAQASGCTSLQNLFPGFEIAVASEVGRRLLP